MIRSADQYFSLSPFLSHTNILVQKVDQMEVVWLIGAEED